MSAEVERQRRKRDEARVEATGCAAEVCGAWEAVRETKMALALPPAFHGALQRLSEAFDTYMLEADKLHRMEAALAQPYNRAHLARWQADHLAQQLHLVSTGVRGWQTDQAGHGRPSEQVTGSVGRPAYLLAQCPAVPELGLPRTALRLWKTEFGRLLEEAPPEVRDALAAHLARPRHSALWYLDKRNRAVSAVGTANRTLADWFLVVVQIAEPVRPADGLTVGEMLEAPARPASEPVQAASES